jgi:hypothetical protein
MMPVELKQALNKALKPSTGLQDPKKCHHNRKAGDEQGVSCLDCDTTLEGRGYEGKTGKTCVHKFINNDGDQLLCIYCQELKTK